LTIALTVNYVPDTEMLEYVCNENEKDSAHLVGKASDDIKGDVKVSGQVLARYAGNYESSGMPMKMKAIISVASDQLKLSIGGKGGVPLTTLSETEFYFPGGFPMDFMRDDKGVVTHFLLHTPCGDMKFVRADDTKP
jgi:hypothetical protein